MLRVIGIVLGVLLLGLALLLAVVALFVKNPDGGQSTAHGIGFTIGKWLPSAVFALLGSVSILLGWLRSPRGSGDRSAAVSDEQPYR